MFDFEDLDNVQAQQQEEHEQEKIALAAEECAPAVEVHEAGSSAALVAARVLGISALAELPQDQVPSDWCGILRGKDLFVPGWGGFDIEDAYRASLSGDSADGLALPSVRTLRSWGYLAKFFSIVSEGMHRERLRQILATPESTLAKYIVRHNNYWSNSVHANRLDEVQQYFETQVSAKNLAKATKELPGGLLNRLKSERKLREMIFVRFDYLCGTFQPVRFSESGDELDADHVSHNLAEDFDISALQDSHAVAHAALELNNCSADYVGDVRRKRCALIVLRRRGKILAMGEWDLHERRWLQISEHNDEPVRGDWQEMFDKVRAHSHIHMQI